MGLVRGVSVNRLLTPGDLAYSYVRFSSVSFNDYSMSNHDSRALINVTASKLRHFDGTNFAKWKHMMKAYSVGLHPKLWEIVKRGVNES
jgi:hypothetical protein